MAGDWLKVEKDTPFKPEVLAIASTLNIHPYEAFGRCFQVWSWVDSQSVTGLVPNVTLLNIDTIAGLPGFASAMVDVGWLVLRTKGIEFPNFNRHMSEPAKQRALTAKRVRRHTNAKPNAPCVTREEKRREESKERSPPFKKPTREEVQAYCRERNNSVDADKFIDHYESNGWRIGGKAPMKDWRASIRQWERNDFGSRPKLSEGHAVPTLTAEQAIEKRRREDAELASQPRKTSQQIREEMEADDSSLF